jgi:hypothetical protein
VFFWPWRDGGGRPPEHPAFNSHIMRLRQAIAARPSSASLIKGLYCFRQNNECSKCEVAHTSVLIGRPSFLFGRSTAYAVVRRSSKTAPLRRGFFAPHALFLSVSRAGKLGTTRGWVCRVNAKGPVSDNGAFRTFLRWRGMLSDPTAFSIRHALIWFQEMGWMDQSYYASVFPGRRSMP